MRTRKVVPLPSWLSSTPDPAPIAASLEAGAMAAEHWWMGCGFSWRMVPCTQGAVKGAVSIPERQHRARPCRRLRRRLSLSQAETGQPQHGSRWRVAIGIARGAAAGARARAPLMCMRRSAWHRFYQSTVATCLRIFFFVQLDRSRRYRIDQNTYVN